MARKAKLEGETLKQFMAERTAGAKLKDLSVKYGLTQSRLSQIYVANSLDDYTETAHQHELPLEEVVEEIDEQAVQEEEEHEANKW